MKEANVKDRSKEVEKFSQKKKDFINTLRSSCIRDTEDRSTWNTKMVIAHYQRMGVKRYSNFPYPGAPDIPLPETDKIIKKMVPTLVLSSWGPKKICTVKVEEGYEITDDLKEKARKAEKAMNMYLRGKDQDWFRKLMLAADNAKQYGHCIFKVYEQFKTYNLSKTLDLEDESPELRNADSETLKSYISVRFNLDLEDEDEKEIVQDVVTRIKAGEDIVDFEVPMVKCLPVIEVIHPTKLTVPAHTTDINLAERIRYEYYLSANQIERLMEDGIFLKRDLKEVPKASDKGKDFLTTSMARSEGISDNTS